MSLFKERLRYVDDTLTENEVLVVDIETGVVMTMERAMIKVKAGEYPGYHIHAIGKGLMIKPESGAMEVQYYPDK